MQERFLRNARRRVSKRAGGEIGFSEIFEQSKCAGYGGAAERRGILSDDRFFTIFVLSRAVAACGVMTPISSARASKAGCSAVPPDRRDKQNLCWSYAGWRSMAPVQFNDERIDVDCDKSIVCDERHSTRRPLKT